MSRRENNPGSDPFSTKSHGVCSGPWPILHPSSVAEIRSAVYMQSCWPTNQQIQMKTLTNISVFWGRNMFYKMYVFQGFQPTTRPNGYSLAPPGTAFTYMYEIGYTCISQLNLQKVSWHHDLNPTGSRPFWIKCSFLAICRNSSYSFNWSFTFRPRH